jgi:hypothetical protein
MSLPPDIAVFSVAPQPAGPATGFPHPTQHGHVEAQLTGTGG